MKCPTCKRQGFTVRPGQCAVCGLYVYGLESGGVCKLCMAEPRRVRGARVEREAWIAETREHVRSGV